MKFRRPLLLLAGLVGTHARASVFHPACTSADLIAAIEKSNGNVEADEINLPAIAINGNGGAGAILLTRRTITNKHGP